MPDLQITEEIHLLVGRQKAEFDKGSQLRTRVLQVQIALGLLSAITIFVTDDVWLYAAGVVGVLLAAVWFYLWRRLDRSRSHAERLRRATMIAGGFGVPIERDEAFELARGGLASDNEAEARVDRDYFASKLPPGPQRFSEMLEESGVWTKVLSRYAATETWILFGGVIIVTILLLFSSVELVPVKAWALAARIFFSMLAVVVSADFLGAGFAYSSTNEEVTRVIERLRRNRAAGCPLEGLMIIFGDYNAAVEGMPLFSKGLYPRYQERLNRDYHLYLTGPQ